MRSSRKIALLQAQIHEGNNGVPDDFETWRNRTASTLRITMGANHPTVAAFESVSYTPGMWTDSTPSSYFAQVEASGVRDAIAVLKGAIHEIEASEPEPPEMATDELHPWIAGAVAGLWDDGHYKAAIEEAARKLDLQIRMKLGSVLTGTKLVTEAFNAAPPKIGQKRLRFTAYKEGTDSWTNAHEGTMAFARGCMMRIRNLIEHEDDVLDRATAAECLAALSLLARWTDEAKVMSAE